MQVLGGKSSCCPKRNRAINYHGWQLMEQLELVIGIARDGIWRARFRLQIFKAEEGRWDGKWIGSLETVLKDCRTLVKSFVLIKETSNLKRMSGDAWLG